MLDCQATPTTTNTKPKNQAEEETSNSSGEEENINCTYCKESGDRLGSAQPIYWGIQLDQDLLETLVAIYPDWFKDYNLNLRSPPSTAMADCGTPPAFLPLSPPKAEVDETPIQKTMDRHKESLKTPPAFHEQRQKLERAKMGDILKSKIQRRPDRQELIQQHILEDTKVDPSLQDKQRQLKKARLADDLNERLSHRPGPLELIKGNILKADEEFSRALKDGQIPFKRTCEGETRKHPPLPFVFEEDSSSEGATSPMQEGEQPQACSPDANGYAALPSPTLGSAVSSLSPISSVASPSSAVAHSPVALATAAIPATASLFVANASPTAAINAALVSPTSKMLFNGKSDLCAAKDQNRSSRKKSKSKSTPKTRTIKFHEYKGPPNAQKALLSNAAQVETSYELLLQQQQLFLQWQLELQHKYPQIILPAAQKSTNSESNSTNSVGSPGQATAAAGVSQVAPASQSSQQEGQSLRCLSKLEDMKVSDLKAELKRRNLPVSGSKPQLIERLKQYSETAPPPLFNGQGSSSTNGICGEISSGPSSLTFDAASSQGSPAEDPSAGMHAEGVASPSDAALEQESLEASLAENGSPTEEIAYGGGSAGGSPSSFSIPSVPPPPPPPSAPPHPLQRPSSVAPMEVDANSNCAFDPMDVSDIGRNLPQVSATTFQHLSSAPASLMAVIADANFVSNAPPNEEILRKKIEELQRELQRSQFQLQQQQQTISQRQRHHQPPQGQQSSVGPATTTMTPSVSTADVSVVLSPEFSQEGKPSSDSAISTPDFKAQQKLMLQQHFQQRIQQHQQLLQQQHQRQQGDSGESGLAPSDVSSPANTNVKASLAAFLQAQAAPNNAPQQPKVYFNGNTNGLTSAVAYNVSNATNAKQRANSLPNGAGHMRTNSLPSFVGLDAIPQKQPIARTTTDPQFVFAKPPPDYDEATKQLSKHQFAQTLIETLNAPSSGRKSVKSQAVDDVLEILIKNGELPASAAQEPPTPPTPKTIQSAILFPNGTSASIVPLSPSRADALSAPTSNPNSAGRIGLLGENLSSSVCGHLGGMPSPVAPSFDLDLSLDLEGLEPMNLEGFTMEGHIKEEEDEDAFLGSSSMDEQVGRSDHDDGNEFVGFGDDGNAMDVDMAEVSEWLDEVLPINGSGTCGGGSLTIIPNNNFNNNVDCNDPLLSANQGIFNLLNLEDDFRVNHDLVWDKLDFAT